MGRVLETFLDALATRFPEDEWRVVLPHGAAAPPPGVRARRARVPGRVLYGTGALVGRPQLDRLLGDVDVVWLPAPAPAALSGHVPHVVTLHDLSWEERPQDFTRYERAWHALARPRRQAAAAARVHCVSEATRTVALARWDLAAERVRVIHPIAPTGPGRPTERTPYFLWVGALEPRKGPDVLAAAWRRARAAGLRAELVVVGDGQEDLSGPGVVVLGRVDDAALRALYDGALALVAPSRLEGFGLPPLEAALQGTPSVLTRLPAFEETLGEDGAIWVDPEDVAALADALLGVAADPEAGRRVAEVARTRAERFTDPSAAADGMRALLAEAATA